MAVQWLHASLADPRSYKTLLATGSDESKGWPIRRHKSNDDARETSPLINHRGTLGSCTLLLIDLPLCPLSRAERSHVFIEGCVSQFRRLSASFTVLQAHSGWTFVVFQSRSNQRPGYTLYVFSCRCTPDWSYHITQKHSDAHKALPSGSGFSFRDVRPFEGNFSAHTLWRVIFLPSQFHFGPHGAGRDLSLA